VTCLLPAIIIHLLDVKSADSQTRQASIRKFQFCMQALQRLREMYASADFAFSFLDAAVRKTSAQLSAAGMVPSFVKAETSPSDGAATEPPKNFLSAPLLLTPPPEAMQSASMLLFNSTLAPEERNLISVYTPPHSSGSASDVSLHSQSHTSEGAAASLADIAEENEDDETLEGALGVDDFTQNDFESLVNLEGGTDLFSSMDDSLHVDMQWLEGFEADGQHTQLKEFSLEHHVSHELLNESGYAEQATDLENGLGLGRDVAVEA